MKKNVKRRMTKAEVDRWSTPKERAAEAQYKEFQRQGRMSETDLLMASGVIDTLVKRNKRLGLV